MKKKRSDSRDEKFNEERDGHIDSNLLHVVVYPDEKKD